MNKYGNIFSILFELLVIVMVFGGVGKEIFKVIKLLAQEQV